MVDIEMEEAGLYIKNQFDITQIDSTYSNAVLIKSFLAEGRPYIRFNAESPLVFISPRNGAFVTYKLIRESATVYGLQIIADAYASSPKTECYIFDIVPPNLQQYNNSGLQVFNEQGIIVYDSNAYYSNFIGVYTFPEYDIRTYHAWTGGYGPRQIFSHVNPESRTGKIAISPLLAQRRYYDAPQIVLLYLPGYTIDGMTIKMTCISYSFTDWLGDAEGEIEKNTVLIADVGSIPLPYDINDSQTS